MKRKKYDVVYVKEGAQIVELLGLMGAGVSLMNLENVRILKGMRNTVNRKVNCETANINKTVNAAVKQMEDIAYIRDTIGLHRLPENLEETAIVRLEYPQASLKELGALLTVPIGKSGINHRLRKISTIAEQLRECNDVGNMDMKAHATSMIRKPITIGISNGLEARPVALLVQIASQYASSIYLENEEKRVNAKSIMGMMSLGLDAGEKVTVSVEGVDEEEAMKGIEEYLSRKSQK